MNAGGVVLILAGAWILAQILAGDLLGRLKIVGG